MSGTIRFHLDENVSNAIAIALRSRGIDVTTTSEEGLMAAPDEVQLEFALSQGRVIFTQDTDFLRLHADGVAHNGIVYCQQGTRSIGEIVRGLILIWELLEPEEMVGHVEFL
jgi:predicted nuclease of predicted toxin-antitoxin system